MPVLCQISKKSVQVHIYKTQTRTIGLAYVRNANMSNFTPQILICNDKGAVGEYTLPGNLQTSSKVNLETVAPAFEDYFTLDKLPRSVTMNIDCLHSTIDLTNVSYLNKPCNNLSFRLECTTACSCSQESSTIS